MSDETLRELREVQEHFRLPSIGLVEKDLYVVKAIAALAAIDAAPFTLVFGGGTALARAHKLVRRMSEDVDFKIVPLPTAPVSRSGIRRALGKLGDQVTAALQAAGFAFDPKDEACTRSQNENRYTVWQLPYAGNTGAGEGLRPTIQIETTYAPLRQAAVTLPVSSFVAEAYGRPPEVARIPCVSVTETAAEKLVALTRRIAMELAGLSRDPDPTLVRHIYDLHLMQGHIEPGQVAALARNIAAADAREFRNQYPAYVTDIAGETRKALDALRTDLAYRTRYGDFIIAMSYGERPEFDVALASVAALTEQTIQHEGDGTC
ncbi:MAG TPA: nucleotidyl transferase AbiEii/AbiGii toxin family protein [Steroidobacteraceae bacterium]|nr:nucleotidyl transferase AbiEii/AbiGii toxin family protein [Steroidobacteraceae bacterium]